jgi:hypothetical protein
MVPFGKIERQRESQPGAQKVVLMLIVSGGHEVKLQFDTDKSRDLARDMITNLKLEPPTLSLSF